MNSLTISLLFVLNAANMCVLCAFDRAQFQKVFQQSRDRLLSVRPAPSVPASGSSGRLNLPSSIAGLGGQFNHGFFKHLPQPGGLPNVYGRPSPTETRGGPRGVRPATCRVPALVCDEGKYRTADGTCNNPIHPTWGAAGQPQVRMLPSDYNDGSDQPRIMSRSRRPLPSARAVSQALHTGDSTLTETQELSHLFTMWGQFFDHDITHTPVSREADGSSLDCCQQPVMYPKRDLYWMPGDISNVFGLGSRTSLKTHVNHACFPISLSPSTDRFFTTASCMNFVRSRAFAPSPDCPSATREQGNTQTAFIDGSQVYGPSLGNQHFLRLPFGGLLKSAQHDLLPRNSSTMCTKREGTADFCFGSGDPRVNEHPMLSTVHTVFHRLHNDLAAQLAALNLHWDDETIFQETRKIVGAILQHITYAEYLPLIFGNSEMARQNLSLTDGASYRYDPHTNPSIINAFSTAAFRFGHSMVNGKNSYGFQTLNLRDMFFRPNFVQRDYGAGLTMVLNGLIRDHSQKCDRHMNKDLTDHLFQTTGGRSLDLASLNIQRGRDHGLPSYNEFRRACGLPSLQQVFSAGKFADVPLLAVYDDLDDVDLFTGGLSESLLPGGSVGPTFACILGKQFRHLKYGDRFWYQNTQHKGALTPAQIGTIEQISFARILCATTKLTAVQIQPFQEPSAENPVQECSTMPPIDLSAWQEFFF